MKIKTWTDLAPLEQGIVAERRERAHWRLDALLNASDRIHRYVKQNVDPGLVLQSKVELARIAATFLAESLRDEALIDRKETERLDDQSYIAEMIGLWFPVLSKQGETKDFWFDAMDEIHRLRWGDEPKILAVAPRKRGSHAQPAKLHRCRIYALEWAAFLKQRNIAPSEYQEQISLAFGATWDTIRHWKKSSGQFFGKRVVASYLADARQGYSYFLAFPDYVDKLIYCAAEYRAVMGIKQLRRKEIERLQYLVERVDWDD